MKVRQMALKVQQYSRGVLARRWVGEGVEVEEVEGRVEEKVEKEECGMLIWESLKDFCVEC